MQEVIIMADEEKEVSKVRVFSTPSCPWCHKVKDFLKDKKVKFEDIDVSTDEDARNEMIEKTGQMGVPVTMIVGKDPIVGFDAEAIGKALGLDA